MVGISGSPFSLIQNPSAVSISLIRTLSALVRLAPFLRMISAFYFANGLSSSIPAHECMMRGETPSMVHWYSIGLLLVVSLLLFLRVNLLCPFHTTGMPFLSPLRFGGIACRGRSGHRLGVLCLPILDNASGALLALCSCRRIGRHHRCGRMLRLSPSAVSSSLSCRFSSKFVRLF